MDYLCERREEGAEEEGARWRQREEFMGLTYANPISICPQHANLLLIHDSVEVLELLLGRDVVVPLFSDGGVLALVDFLSGQGLGHFWAGSGEERERAGEWGTGFGDGKDEDAGLSCVAKRKSLE